MTEEEFGHFGVFNSWLGIIGVFITLNLYLGVYSQGLIKFREDRAGFSSTMQGLVFTLSAFYTVIYLIFHRFFNSRFNLTTVQMIAMLIIIWTSAVFSFWAEEQRVEFKYKAIVFVSLILSVIKPLLCICLVISSEDKVTARIIGLAIIDLLCCSILFVIQLKKGRKFFSKKYWIYAIGFNLPLLPHYLSGTVLSSSDRIMIENITSSGDAGIYNLAYSIALIMTIFNSSLMQTISPWIYQKIKDKHIKDIESIAYKTLVLIAVLNLLLILFAPELISIFGPPEYSAAVVAMPPIIMSVFFMYCYDLFAKFAFYYEKTRFVMIASILGAVLNILLNLIAIPVFGFVAAGYTTLICYIVYALTHYIFMRKVCKECCNNEMPYKTSTILKIAIIFLSLGSLFASTYINNYLRYGLILLFFILLIVFRKKIKTEISSIISIKKKNSQTDTN